MYPETEICKMKLFRFMELETLWWCDVKCFELNKSAIIKWQNMYFITLNLSFLKKKHYFSEFPSIILLLSVPLYMMLIFFVVCGTIVIRSSCFCVFLLLAIWDPVTFQWCGCNYSTAKVLLLSFLVTLPILTFHF